MRCQFSAGLELCERLERRRKSHFCTFKITGFKIDNRCGAQQPNPIFVRDFARQRLHVQGSSLSKTPELRQGVTDPNAQGDAGILTQFWVHLPNLEHARIVVQQVFGSEQDFQPAQAGQRIEPHRAPFGLGKATLTGQQFRLEQARLGARLKRPGQHRQTQGLIGIERPQG